MRLHAVFLLLAITLHVTAQIPLAYNIHAQNGLPCKAVYCIIQDSKGYIWMGSEKGLIRYDGLHYRLFSNKQINGSSVSDLRIDKNGVIRCQSFSGGHYYLSGDSLYTDTLMPLTGDFSQVVEGNNGTAYQLGYNELYAFSKEKDTLQFGNHLLGLFKYGQSVYVFDSSKLYGADDRKQASGIPFSLKGETVFFSAEVNGQLLVFPRNLKARTAYRFLPQFEQVSIELPPVFIQSVNVVDDTLIFISTNNGLYVLNRHLQQLPMQQPLLANKSFSGVMRDSDGALWASTVDNGIYRFGCFDCITTLVNEPVQTLSLLPDGNGVLCGTQAGNVLEWVESGAVNTIYKSMNRQPITALYKPDNQTLLVGGDVFAIHQKGEKPMEWPLAVKSIAPMEDGVFALARTGNISFVKQSKAKADTTGIIPLFASGHWLVFDRYVINNNNLRVRSVVYDTLSKCLYATTSIGLLQVGEKSWKKIEYRAKALYASDIAMYRDTLFATSGATIHLLKSGQVIASRQILPASEAGGVQHMQVNAEGIWIASGSKLYQVSHSLKSVNLFELTNGYEVNDFCITPNRLVLATDAGVTAVSVAQLNAGSSTLRFFIEHFSANGNMLSITGENCLPHTHNNLKLVFSVPYYGKQEEVNIHCKINDEPWQIAENGLRELNLISLEPGKYCVWLKATAAGNKASEVETIRFTIRPPFWKTWWFYGLSLLAVAGMAYLLYSYRMRMIHRQNALEKQKMELESKLRESILASVKAQMNPHFIFNALNTIQSFIYLNDKQNATSYLGKFSQLTRTILDMSNKNSVSLQEEIDAIVLYLELEKTRFDEEMEFTIEVSAEVNTSVVRIPSMIIQPYIENAVKHGLLHKKGERWLKCLFELQNNFLKVTIDDNGIGRVRSAELNKIKNKNHQSFATHANEKRLEALNRGGTDVVSVQYTDKVNEHGEPEGTTVVLTIAILDE